MKRILALLLCLGSLVGAQAAFLPYFDDIRAAVVARQEAISNAPPITAAGKKELNALRTALKNIDKPSTSLKTDLSKLSAVVSGINKGASNEVLALHLSTAVSNYVGVLVQTNDALEAALANANNSATLKAKAEGLLETAQAELAAIQPENNLNAAAKNIGKVLTRYTSAAKAVAAAANAQPTPQPNPKSGTLVVDVAGQRYTFNAVFPLRNETFTGMVETESTSTHSSVLRIDIPSNGGPGTYGYSLTFTEILNGKTTTFFVSGSDAQVTTAKPGVVAGSFSGTGSYMVDGTHILNIPFTVRFSGKSLF